jgi:uncharacterized protein (DUF302 family)
MQESLMIKNCKYGFGTEIALDFDETLSRVETLLNKHNFRVFTRMNLKEIVGGEKIDHLGHYVILGACNSEFARELFSADPDIGMLLPCNIIVYEPGNNRCRVMVKDPVHIMDLINNPIAIHAAMKIKDQMEEIIEELERDSNQSTPSEPY